MIPFKMANRVFKQLFILVMVISFTNCLEVKTIDAVLQNVYRYDIVQGQKHIFDYGEKVGKGKDQNEKLRQKAFRNNNMRSGLRITCSAEHLYDPDCPLILTVTQKKSVMFWEISEPTEPYNFTKNDSVISQVERTLCLNDSLLDDLYLTVEMSTCSKNSIKYSISANLRYDLQISSNKLTRTQITPTSPAVYFFPPFTTTSKLQKLPPEFLFLQLTSSSDNCMVMSIQQPICPISDTVETFMTHGQWQTITTKTGMTISTEEFPRGFFLVFLLLAEDSLCNHPSLGQSEVVVGGISSKLSALKTHSVRRKTIHFVVREEIPTASYHLALFIPLGFFLTFLTVVLVIHFHFHHIRCNLYKFDCKSINTNNGTCTIPISTLPYPFDRLGTDANIGNQSAMRMGSTDSIIRSRIQIGELINSKPERLMVQSKRYYMLGILVASFYCVPVFQLILSYHRRLQETGNYDLCYFNYYCAHRLGTFHDFNHIFSNLGYLICGPVFICIVYLRQNTVEKISSGNTPLSSLEIIEKRGGSGNLASNWIPKAPWDISKGVFVHHGLFYAMGFSLFMTGVMSSAYHICPNQNNFQFDTAFMYTIAALGVVTIYQFRHPTYVSANMTFMGLAVVAASTVVGLLWESNKFRIFFTVTHLTFLLVILIYIHYVGYIRVNGVTVTEWKIMFEILRRKWVEDIKSLRLIGFQRDVWSPKDDPRIIVLPGPCRLIFPILVVGVNFAALTMIWTMMPTANFASQVLAVYVINCSVYSVYYSVMKVIHYECRGKLWLQPAFYSITSTILWMWSLTYFGDVVTLWERSPAESRARNAECIFLGFYDSHDIWHFISASALFCSLMNLLTIDDDLIDRPKSEIPVF